MPDHTFSFLPPPSHDAEIERVLNALAAGATDPGELETEGVDLKEEAGRRAGAKVLPGQPRDERVAKQLAAEAACFANTRGGGVIIVGVDDHTGELIGAASDTDWLRTRLYQLTDSKVTVDIREAEVKGSRLLVIAVPQAVEPVPFERRYQHRRGAACVPVTSTQLLQGLFAGVAADPSHRESGMKVDEVSESTFRSLLRRAAMLDSRRSSLSRRDLLARLGLLYGDTDSLNHAGEILLGRRAFPALDYTYRRVPGGSSLARVCESGLSLLEELDLVEAEYTRRNPFRELTLGLAVVRVYAIPERTLREAILNGVCHRDWRQPEPTIVEHIGHELRVTSPGGLPGDVSVDNIITHPSLPRYRTLMNAVRQLGLVEQEGTGIDRMVADLIRIGSEPPLIEATEQPAVRVVLRGRPVDEGRFQFFAGLRMPSEDQEMPPEPDDDDVDAALLIWRAMNPETAFLTAHSCAPLLQRTLADTAQVLLRVASYRIADDRPLLARVPVPDGTPPAWHLSRGARSGLRAPRVLPATATAWARERRRISSAEYSAIASVSQPTANSHLRSLAEAEGLVPSRPSGRGPGFHYLYPEFTEES